MADETNSDPASLEEAVPESDRGQGAHQQDPRRAIDEAAADGVNLNSDRDEPRTGAARGDAPPSLDEGDPRTSDDGSGTSETD